jgi:tight adherence protein B
MRPRSLIAPVLLGWAILGAGVAGAAPKLVPVQTLETKAPKRAFVVTATGGPEVTAESFQVFENGNPVRNLTVRPQSGGLQQAIVFDASNSMRGAPFRAATTATRELVRNAPAGVRMSVYAFNHSTKRLVDFDTDPEVAATAVDGARMAEGTFLYDAVKQAARDLAKQPAGTRTIVAISDGADSGSAASLEEATKAARDAGVKVFTIGLASPQFDKRSLVGLADRTSGTYSEAPNAAALARLETSLVESLSRRWVVSWESNVTAPGATAQASIQAPGYGEAGVSYAVPTVRVVKHAPTFWDSGVATGTAIALAAVLAFIAAILVLRPNRQTIASRLSEYQMAVKARETRDGDPFEDLVEATERRMKRFAWGRTLEIELDRAGMTVRPASFVLLTGSVSLAVGLLLVLLLQSPLIFPVGALLPVLAWVRVRMKARKRLRDFGEQLPDNLTVLAQALRAGFALLQALDVVSENAAEPSKSEFRRVLAQARLGDTLEKAMEELGQRMQSREFTWVVAIVGIQGRVGGNMAEIFDSVSDSIRASQRLKRQVRALTAQGRMTQMVLTGLPFGIGALITLLNPELMNEMYSRTLGIAALVVAGGMSLLGSYVISRIIKIEI